MNKTFEETKKMRTNGNTNPLIMQKDPELYISDTERKDYKSKHQ